MVKNSSVLVQAMDCLLYFVRVLWGASAVSIFCQSPVGASTASIVCQNPVGASAASIFIGSIFFYILHELLEAREKETSRPAFLNLAAGLLASLCLAS